MPRFQKKSPMPVSAEELYAWHMAPGAFEKLVPPWQKVKVLEQPEELKEGAILLMKVYFGPVGVEWEALHRDFVEGRQFVDEQVRGPFGRWVHTHSFEPQEDGTSVLVDTIEFEPPLGWLGRLGGGTLITGKMLEKMFAERHRVTREDLQRAA